MINKKLDEIKASLGVVEELIQDNKYLESLDKGLEKQKHINIDLQKRINKAIDFLKENACIDEDVEYFCDDLRYDDCKKLLEILKGEDKE